MRCLAAAGQGQRRLWLSVWLGGLVFAVFFERAGAATPGLTTRLLGGNPRPSENSTRSVCCGNLIY